MITKTRRPITRAAYDWQDAAVCRQTDSDLFFSDAYRDQDTARKMCVGCPALLECLTTTLGDERKMPSGYRFGIAGGLRADQRRALHWETVLHGGPDIDQAAELSHGRSGFRFAEVWRSCGSLEAVADRLAQDGTVVDLSTVRLAVWWQGGRSPRVAPRGPSDPTEGARLARDYADVLYELSGRGAPRADMAAYLGVSLEPVVLAMRRLNNRRAAA
ncbi:WhiB family transcriptional regulator [Streptomyces sp. DH12]|uniref:WhiB family transcriptional regulator n=1 Tax=Streptomyces sp. DH12 TaxID=2857010 RepID=UPI001E4B35BA|nr:WhiB family transcriptional regulator [Streptomyces sp. DH12]